jgi:hypothetical protein
VLGAPGTGKALLMAVDRRLQALLEHGREAGCLNLSEVNELLRVAELDDERVEGLFRGVLADELAFAGWHVSRHSTGSVLGRSTRRLLQSLKTVTGSKPTATSSSVAPRL